MSTTIAERPPLETGERLHATPLRANIELIATLINRDTKARYKQSLLGILWAVINPLVLAFIYTILGYYFLKQRSGVVPFPIYAYVGLLFWNLFAGGLSGATESLVAHINLITKVYFPREVFPISAVLGKLVDLGFGLLGLLPLLLYFHIGIGIGALCLIPLLLLLLLFTTGLGLLAACANLFFRDVRHVVGILLSLWIYMVPNFYTLDQIPPHLRNLYLLDPMATYIETARRLLFPALGEPLPIPFLAIAATVSVSVFVTGYIVFKRNEPRFAEYI